jgi:hypothetical protein
MIGDLAVTLEWPYRQPIWSVTKSARAIRPIPTTVTQAEITTSDAYASLVEALIADIG